MKPSPWAHASRNTQYAYAKFHVIERSPIRQSYYKHFTLTKHA